MREVHKTVHKCREMWVYDPEPAYRYLWTAVHKWVRFYAEKRLTLFCTKCQHCGQNLDPVMTNNQVTIE